MEQPTATHGRLVLHGHLSYPQVRRGFRLMQMEQLPVATTTFSLEPVPPFRLDLTVWVLKRRPDYIVDQWDGETYRRTLLVENEPLAIAVRQSSETRLEVVLRGSETAVARRDLVQPLIERLLGTNVDLSDYYAFADQDDRLRPLVRRFAGFKPPRYPTLFECLTNAIACQQVTLTFGLQVVSRLVERYGRPPEFGDGCAPPAFPAPAEIADADPDYLREIGFSRQKARALIELAQGLESGAIDFSNLDALDDEAAVRTLSALRGVGRWTAEYALLRGLGRLHIFPGDDVGARNTLRTWTNQEAKLDYDGVHATLANWKPYAGLLYFQMLLLGLEAKGRVNVGA